MQTTLPVSLEGQNAFTLMLVQATCGAISPNFRAVAISFASSTWEMLFVLETESEQDREEIQEIVAEFDALILGIAHHSVKLATTVLVTAEPLPLLDPSKWRLVFRRREM